MRVTFSPLSRNDLIDIGDCIAQDSRANARRFAAKLRGQCQRIGRAPWGYASREDLAAALRMAPFGRYIVFFRVLDGVVRIERVLHATRNLPALLTGEHDV